ncbi:MAG: YybH family protein [Rhizobiaceae bacterium]
MTDPMEVLEIICESYQSSVSANDSAAYSGQFSSDAIRLPPGGKPEYGPEEIRKNEQKDYDIATWTIEVRPVHALRIDDDWVYGVAETDITLVAHADGSKKTMTANKGWLINRQPTGEWLIKRAMWNYQ